MAGAVYHQASFLGGEWSPLAQGRSDLDAYKTAMNVCYNGFPSITGAWVRRSGTWYKGPTIDREFSKLAKFVPAGADPILVEYGNSKMRFFQGSDRLTSNDDRTVTASSSSNGFLALALDAAHGWLVGETVFIELPSSPSVGAGYYLNRLMTISSVTSTTEIVVVDDLGDAFDFDSPANAALGCTVKRLREITTSWTGASVLYHLRTIQASDKLITLSGSVYPKSLPITASGGVVSFGSLADVDFQDGPYLDAQETSPGVNETGTVSGYTGSITFTPLSTTFDANDVGRHIRLLQEPPQWDSGTTYSYGDYVTYQDEWWMSIAADDYASSNVGIVPGTLATVNGSSVVLWAPAAEAGIWSWGVITAQATTSCTVSLDYDLKSTNGATITEWRLGVYKTGQYPTCGTYHNGRLLLAGAIPNRIDASKSNDDITFSPTDKFGDVQDDSGIGMVLNFDEQQTIYWLASDERGVIVGTEGGEIILKAEGSGITPYDREADKMTRYQCANREPCRAGDAIVFVQYFKRYLIEYRPRDYSARFDGVFLNEFSQHITPGLINEVVYQQTPQPVIWFRDRTGRMRGLTYRRDRETGLIVAAHRQEFVDDARRVAGMRPLALSSGLGEVLYLVTSEVPVQVDGQDITDLLVEIDGSDFAIEILQPPIQEN